MQDDLSRATASTSTWIPGTNSPPSLIYKVAPEYTDKARAARLAGVVLLDGEIGTDGKPDLLKVRRSLGLGLDEKAIDCVKRWRFKQAYKTAGPWARKRSSR